MFASTENRYNITALGFVCFISFPRMLIKKLKAPDAKQHMTLKSQDSFHTKSYSRYELRVRVIEMQLVFFRPLSNSLGNSARRSPTYSEVIKIYKTKPKLLNNKTSPVLQSVMIPRLLRIYFVLELLLIFVLELLLMCFNLQRIKTPPTCE